MESLQISVPSLRRQFWGVRQRNKQSTEKSRDLKDEPAAAVPEEPRPLSLLNPSAPR